MIIECTVELIASPGNLDLFGPKQFHPKSILTAHSWSDLFEELTSKLCNGS